MAYNQDGGVTLSRKFTRQSTDMTGTPSAAPIQPPLEASASADPIYKTDIKEVMAGVRALTSAMSSQKLEDVDRAKRALGQAAVPMNDDLTRIAEGRTAAEAWAELDRLKKAAGILPK